MQRLTTILNRIEDFPAPPAPKSVYDTTRKYRIVCEQEIEYADTLPEARYVAGLFLVEKDGLCLIHRQQGRPRRWKASIRGPAFKVDVRLTELYADSDPDDAFSRRQQALLAQMDKHAASRRRAGTKRRPAKPRQDDPRENRRGVVCVSCEPPRPFASASAVADWLMCRRQSVWRHLRQTPRRPLAGWFFRLAAEILADANADAGLKAAALAANAAAELRVFPKKQRK